MSCQRCHGLMVVDHCVDLEDSGKQFWLPVCRCMNCGDVVEPEIIRHRMGKKPPPSGRLRQRARTYRNCGVIFVGN